MRFFPASEGQDSAAARWYLVMRAWTASRDIAVPRRVTNSGSSPLPGFRPSQARSAATAWASSGVHRSRLPLPVQRTCAPVPSRVSARVSRVSSDTRSPVRIAVSQERVVAASGPGLLVGDGEQGVAFVVGEPADDRPCRPGWPRWPGHAG